MADSSDDDLGLGNLGPLPPTPASSQGTTTLAEPGPRGLPPLPAAPSVAATAMGPLPPAPPASQGTTTSAVPGDRGLPSLPPPPPDYTTPALPKPGYDATQYTPAEREQLRAGGIPGDYRNVLSPEQAALARGNNYALYPGPGVQTVRDGPNSTSGRTPAEAAQAGKLNANGLDPYQQRQEDIIRAQARGVSYDRIRTEREVKEHQAEIARQQREMTLKLAALHQPPDPAAPGGKWDHEKELYNSKAAAQAAADQLKTTNAAEAAALNREWEAEKLKVDLAKRTLDAIDKENPDVVNDHDGKKRADRREKAQKDYEDSFQKLNSVVEKYRQRASSVKNPPPSPAAAASQKTLGENLGLPPPDLAIHTPGLSASAMMGVGGEGGLNQPPGAFSFTNAAGQPSGAHAHGSPPLPPPPDGRGLSLSTTNTPPAGGMGQTYRTAKGETLTEQQIAGFLADKPKWTRQQLFEHLGIQP